MLTLDRDGAGQRYFHWTTILVLSCLLANTLEKLAVTILDPTDFLEFFQSHPSGARRQLASNDACGHLFGCCGNWSYEDFRVIHSNLPASASVGDRS